MVVSIVKIKRSSVVRGVAYLNETKYVSFNKVRRGAAGKTVAHGFTFTSSILGRRVFF